MYRILFFLTATFTLFCLLAPAETRAHGGHETGGYHMHTGAGDILVCRSVAECHEEQAQLLMATTPSNGGCDEGVQKNSTVGPVKYYTSHWWIRTFTQCTYNGEGVGANIAYTFTWYMNDIPTECNNGTDAPYCEHTGPEFYLTTAPEPACESSDETNPCNPSDGNKSQSEQDYISAASGGLSFTRYYNSLGLYKSDQYLAPGWRHTYSRYLDESSDIHPAANVAIPIAQSGYYATASDACTSGWNEIKATAWSGDLAAAVPSFKGGNICALESGGSTQAYLPVRSAGPSISLGGVTTVKAVTRPNSRRYIFQLLNGVWESLLDPTVSLAESGSDWIFTDANDTQETYNSSGKLVSITYRNGQTETLDYNLTVGQGGDNNSATLDRVTGPFGHELTFAYNAGQLQSVTTPDGAITYAYGSYDTLSTVTYPDASTREYLYEDPIDTGRKHHLNGIIDENDDQYATWDYDLSGRAVLSEHAGGKERVELEYNTDGTTTLTMANGATRTYTFGTEQGRRKVTSLSGSVCSTCAGGEIKDRSYDTDGFLSEVTDWEGNVTKFQRNARGLTESRTEAYGTADQRLTTTLWHANFRLPTQATSPKNVTTFTHDVDGNILTATITGGGNSRAWTFTYSSNGQPLTIDGPRTTVTDVTTLEYYTCTTGSECGQIKKVTNALGHVTTYDVYDTAGRLTQMTDPNGLKTSLTYDNRGRLLTSTQTPTLGTARTTTRTYDDAGQLETLTLPDGLVLTYVYDAAHYLVSVTDNLGNFITYDYDEMGSLITEETHDPSTTLTRAMSYTRDLNYRLDTVSDGPVDSDLGFDLVGNLVSSADGNSELTQHTYDSLNRLDSTIDALSGVIDYDYDDHDNLLQVEAANGATTDYVYDALDNLTSETSPDRGLITYTYDDAGNRLTMTDARNVTATYAYDALNRLTSITYPTTAENVSFTYDHGPSEGIGRLRSLADQSGTTTHSYNEFGDVITDQRTIGGTSYSVSYQYDAAGDLASMTYPSGRVVSYGRDAAGRVTTATSTKNGTQKSIVSSASYEPFGPMSNLTFGNTVSFNYGRRTDYRVSDIDSTGVSDVDYTYDAAGNLIERRDNDEPLHNQLFTYDALSRLESTARPYGAASGYASTVLSELPYLYWRFEEAAGTSAADSSGNGRNGVYSGPVLLGNAGLLTESPKSVRISPADSAHVESPALTGVSVTGVEGWFEIESTPSDRVLLMLYKTSVQRAAIIAEADGRISVLTYKSKYMYSDNAVSLSEPHHIAVWYESSTNKTYMMIDGVTQQQTFNAGNLLAIADPTFYVGASLWTSPTVYRVYHGSVDEVAVYDSAVDAGTFQSNYLASTGDQESLTYDANGNRLSVDNGSVANYTYTLNTNRLTNAGASAFQLDASGNRLSDQGGSRVFGYNDSNRLSSVTSGGVSAATYVHNGFGQRTEKTTAAGATVYLYDLEGHLIAEHDGTGALIRDYAWIGDRPVAQIDAGETFTYLHVDHLNTPRLATDDAETIVWRWDSNAFGSTAANEDPDNDSNAMVINLRFPGQYFDTETGLHYNYFRTYDPSTGRYLESDPIGLSGGLNTYGYVGGNPLSFVDPYGLDKSLTEQQRNAYTNAMDKYRAKRDFEIYQKLCQLSGGANCDAPQVCPTNEASVDAWGNFIDIFSTATGVFAAGSRFPNSALRIPPAAQLRIPPHVRDTLNHINKTGSAPPGFKGGRTFQNDGRGGGQVLPQRDAAGNAIGYREYDVNPYTKGTNRGSERLVRGSDGTSYYTNDHYGTFTPIE